MQIRGEKGFPGGAVVKNLPANTGDTGDTGLIPESGRSTAVGNGILLQDSCLENPMDSKAWWVTFQSVSKHQAEVTFFWHLSKSTVQPVIMEYWV